MENRLANGKTLPGTEVVAADAIARLSGVSGKDVNKVLIAIAALHTATGIEPRVLVDIDAAPSAPADDVRFEHTVGFVDAVVHKLQKNRTTLVLLDMLKVHKRFARHTQPTVTIRSTHGPLRAYS